MSPEAIINTASLFIIALFAVDRSSDHELRISVVFHEHPPEVLPYHADRHQLNTRYDQKRDHQRRPAGGQIRPAQPFDEGEGGHNHSGQG
jgi:hypothetical protein